MSVCGGVGACGCRGSAEGVHRRAESKVFHRDLIRNGDR